MPTSADPLIRPARDGDSPGLIDLVEACWLEYPGIILDVDLELPELRAIATAYLEGKGRFWVAEQAGAVVGSVGCLPARDPAGLELRKLYVRRDLRRRGLGSRLSGLVEEEGRARGARFVELWSDARFTSAHRLYERLGYRRSPGTRSLHDLSHSVEFHYRKELSPGEPIPRAAFPEMPR